VGIFELTFFLIHKNLYNPPIAHLAIGCVSVYLIGANLQAIKNKNKNKMRIRVLYRREFAGNHSQKSACESTGETYLGTDLGEFCQQFHLKRRLAEIMSADKQFYDRWWEGLCSEDANRRELAQLSALVASINKSILLRSTEPLNNPSTRDMAGHAHAQCNAAQRNATLALESQEMQELPVRREEARGTEEQEARALQLRESGFAESTGSADSLQPRQSLLSRLRTTASCLLRRFRRGGPRDMPRVRQMAAKSQDEVDLTQFFASPVEVLYGNSCDSCMDYYLRPLRLEDPIKMYSRRQLEGTLEVCRSIDSLYLQATCLRPILQRKLEQLVSAYPNACRVGGSLQTPLKDPARAVQKALRVYANDVSLLMDICREVLVFHDLHDLHAVLHGIQEDAEVKIMRVKNRLDPAYDSALSCGYRDVKINIRLETRETVSLNLHHHIVELQLVPHVVYERRSEGLNHAPGDSSSCAPEAARYNRSRSRAGYTGHMNYVLWRDLRGL
jgi:hypothetical protein